MVELEKEYLLLSDHSAKKKKIHFPYMVKIFISLTNLFQRLKSLTEILSFPIMNLVTSRYS